MNKFSFYMGIGKLMYLQEFNRNMNFPRMQTLILAYIRESYLSFIFLKEDINSDRYTYKNFYTQKYTD